VPAQQASRPEVPGQQAARLEVPGQQTDRLPYRPGEKKQLKSQDVTAKLVGFDILRMAQKIFYFVLGIENPERGK
jgi:hypothetical protein